jgi:hypothetical protein
MLQLRLACQNLADRADAEYPQQTDQDSGGDGWVSLFGGSHSGRTDSEPLGELGLGEPSASPGPADQLPDSP